jgi:hypothetical protein
MPSQPPAAGAAGSAAGTGGNAAAGTGGNAAAGSGGELAAGTGGMAAPAASDAELIGQLIGSLSPYAANQAVGALIALLASSPTLTPSAMTQVLTLLAQVGGCAADAAVCQPACNVVQQRCLVCSPDPNCHASMERVCGAGTSMCH